MKVLIVDDHALFREGLCHVLRQLEPDVNAIEAGNYDTALEKLAQHRDLDLMLLDLNMPDKDGFSVLDVTGKQYPTLPVAVLSASRKPSDVERVMATSAMGYIPKDTTSEVMLGAVRMILAGGIYTPPSKQLEQDRVAQPDVHLTPRQIDVMSMMVRGHSNKQIAAELSITEATTKMHITSIFRSLGVTNRTQATLAAQKLGIAPSN